MSAPGAEDSTRFHIARWASTCASWLPKLMNGSEIFPESNLKNSHSNGTVPPDAEQPKRAIPRRNMARIRRFQRGLIFKRGTRKKVWVGRWWEDVMGLNGQVERIRRSEILAT